MVSEFSNLFPTSYEESRARFRAWLPHIQEIWPGATLHQHALNIDPELTIDWITADAGISNDNMLMFTTAEHGVEGYVGSAVLELFLRKFLPKLNPSTTGLTLVHTINPWGMKYHRRTNSQNIDLNRNFVLENSQLDPAFNPFYSKIERFVGPAGQATNLGFGWPGFLAGYLANLLRYGKDKLWAGKVLGQYAYPQGIHYGGDRIQEEVTVAGEIYHQALASGKKVLHLDMHTGYGPRYQMTIVNSPLEPKPSTAFIQELGYPLVAAMTPDEFYEVRGDMVDYVYLLRQKEYPNTELYATAFEFGTFGDSHWSNLRSLRAMIYENRVYWNGASYSALAEEIRREFLESFSPSESKWRQKAIADAEEALGAILRRMEFF